MRNIFLLFIIYNSIAFTFAHRQVVNSDETLNSLEYIKTKIKLLDKSIKKDGEQSDNLQEELRQIEIELGKHQHQLDTTTQEIKYLNQTKLSLTLQHDKLVNQAIQKKKLLIIYLRKGYSVNNQNKLKQFLTILDSNNILKNIKFYSVISQKQQQAIKEIDNTINEINAVNNKLIKTIEQLTEKQTRLSLILKQISLEKNQRQFVIEEINKRLKSEYNVLDKYNQEKEELGNLIKLVNNDQKDLNNQISKNSLFEQLKGQLSLPVYRKISVEKRLNGIIIKAKRGTLVHSIFPGQIIFSNWIKNFGLVIIIKHANDYISVYGHNQTVIKEKGEWVSRDEVIATVGDSGGLDSPGLYFEIRDKDKPLDLQSWLL